MTARVIQCQGKARFLTYRVANRVARRQSKRHGEHYEPYACRHCSGLHIGTGTATAKPKAKREYERMSRTEMLKAAFGAPATMLIIVGLCYGVEMLR